jgi:hypothetical protein
VKPGLQEVAWRRRVALVERSRDAQRQVLEADAAGTLTREFLEEAIGAVEAATPPPDNRRVLKVLRSILEEFDG